MKKNTTNKKGFEKIVLQPLRQIQQILSKNIKTQAKSLIKTIIKRNIYSKIVLNSKKAKNWL